MEEDSLLKEVRANLVLSEDFSPSKKSFDPEAESPQKNKELECEE